MIDMMITKIVKTPAKTYGFAASEDGTEYFIPRATILFAEMDVDDEGAHLTANTRPSPHEGGLALVIAKDLQWADED